MIELLEQVNKVVDTFIAEKEVIIRNSAIYVTIFSSENSGFARKISPSASPRIKTLFFMALKEYHKR